VTVTALAGWRGPGGVLDVLSELEHLFGLDLVGEQVARAEADHVVEGGKRNRSARFLGTHQSIAWGLSEQGSNRSCQGIVNIDP
jgi:hypothetical protein